MLKPNSAYAHTSAVAADVAKLLLLNKAGKRILRYAEYGSTPAYNNHNPTPKP